MPFTHKFGNLLFANQMDTESEKENRNGKGNLINSGYFGKSKKVLFGLPTVGVALDINPHKRVNIFGAVSGLPAGSYGYL